MVDITELVYRLLENRKRVELGYLNEKRVCCEVPKLKWVTERGGEGTVKREWAEKNVKREIKVTDGSAEEKTKIKLVRNIWGKPS